MKKRILYYLLLIFMIVPCFVFAEESEDVLKMSTNKTSFLVNSKGTSQEIKLFLSATSDLNVTSCQFTISTEGDVSLTDSTSSAPNPVVKASGFELTNYSNGTYVLLNESGLSLKGNASSSDVLFGISYDINGEGKVKFADIKCGSADEDKEYDLDPITVNMDVETVIVKIDNSEFGGGIYQISSDKDSFVLSLSADDESTLSNFSVKAMNTASGTVTLCDSSNIGDCTIEFESSKFCVNDSICEGLKSQTGNVISIEIYNGSTKFTDFMVTKIVSEEEKNTDNTISSLTVYGVSIDLQENVTEYSINVSEDNTNWTVEATLSDPENYKWDDKDYPEKYTYYTDKVNLGIILNNSDVIGSDNFYTINVTVGDGSSDSSESSSSSIESSSSDFSGFVPASDSSSSVKSQSSSSGVYNPPTGSIVKFIVAIVLICSFAVSIKIYRTNISTFK